MTPIWVSYGLCYRKMYKKKSVYRKRRKIYAICVKVDFHTCNGKNGGENSMFPRRCLLFAKLFSTAPMYADENNFTKYTFLFQHAKNHREVVFYFRVR